MTGTHCRACGAVTVASQTPPHLRCTSCGAMDWVNPAPAACVAILREGRVLLSKRAHAPKAGEWDLVGGFMEPGETPEEAARREVLEETGCVVDAVVHHRTVPGDYAGKPTLNFLFTALTSGTPEAADDALELRWFPLDQVPPIAWPHEAGFVRDLALGTAPAAQGFARLPALLRMSWPTAADHLKPDRIVVIPLGAAAKEHGPHLPVSTDRILADRLAQCVAGTDLVLAPTLDVHHYPAFREFPGSVSLEPETATRLVVDIVRSLAHYGPRRFYILNTGISTVGPLRAASDVLRADGIRLAWLDLSAALDDTERRIGSQPAGTHADETETSIMLHLAPELVDMALAPRDVTDGPGPFSRERNPSGTFGDATLATAAKGEEFLAAILAQVRADLAALRAT